MDGALTCGYVSVGWPRRDFDGDCLDEDRVCTTGLDTVREDCFPRRRGLYYDGGLLLDAQAELVPVKLPERKHQVLLYQWEETSFIRGILLAV